MTERETGGRSIADRIIRSRGERPTHGRFDGGNDEHRYDAFVATEGFPQMGFSVFCANGKRHGFFYHNIDSLDLEEGQHGQYLRLTHRGKAMTLRGEGPCMRCSRPSWTTPCRLPTNSRRMFILRSPPEPRSSTASALMI